MQLAILGILALGGGLLLIYLNLNRKPAAKAEKSRPAGNEDDKGKVIYLFGETRGDEGAEDGKS